MNLFNYKSGKKLSKLQSWILTSYFKIEGFYYKMVYSTGVTLGIIFLFSPYIMLILLALLLLLIT